MKAEVLKELSAPLTVTWEINRTCNLSCAHCLSASGRGVQVALPDAKRIIQQFVALRIFQVSIGGGEPLLHPDIFTILEECVSGGLLTCMSTNGTLVTDQKARRLADLGVRIQVSLDGATDQTNDAVRGQGTFRRILRGLERLSRQQLRLAVNVVLTRLNFGELDNLLTLAQEFGADLRVSRLRPSGRASDSWQALHPTAEQLLSLRDWLGEHPGVLDGDSFFFLRSGKRPAESNGAGMLPARWVSSKPDALDRCGAASMTCCISPESNVYPCAFLQWEPFLAGNLAETDLGTIWRQAPVLTAMRTGPLTCAGCHLLESCGGGCAAVSYGAKGSIAAIDPECLVASPPRLLAAVH